MIVEKGKEGRVEWKCSMGEFQGPFSVAEIIVLFWLLLCSFLSLKSKFIIHSCIIIILLSTEPTDDQFSSTHDSLVCSFLQVENESIIHIHSLQSCDSIHKVSLGSTPWSNELFDTFCKSPLYNVVSGEAQVALSNDVGR